MCNDSPFLTQIVASHFSFSCLSFPICEAQPVLRAAAPPSVSALMLGSSFPAVWNVLYHPWCCSSTRAPLTEKKPEQLSLKCSLKPGEGQGSSAPTSEWGCPHSPWPLTHCCSAAEIARVKIKISAYFSISQIFVEPSTA